MSGNGNSHNRCLARRLRRAHYHAAQLETPLPSMLPIETAPAQPHHGHKHGAASEVEKAVEHLREQLVRTQAEFDNYRKRQRRDEQQNLEQANQQLLKQLLPVLDNFQRALQFPGETVQGLLDGVDMVQKQLLDILKQSGLEKIEALGQPFDPNLHEAVSMAPPAEGQADNSVAEVFQEGYTLKGKLVRPAMVKVARA